MSHPNIALAQRAGENKVGTALPRRIEEFRIDTANSIPCVPSTDEVRSELLSMNLCDVVFTYMNWAQRFIPPRVRTVHFAPGFWTRNALRFEQEIYDLANRSRRGESLIDFLSDKLASQGYVSKRRRRKQRGIEWGDKDFALNVFDTHHLHLSKRGSEELIFAWFGRDWVYFLLCGNHKSFDDGTLEQTVVTQRAETICSPSAMFSAQKETSVRANEQNSGAEE